MAILIATTTMMYAQQSGKKEKGKAQKGKSLTPEERAVKITNRLQKELTLTAEQTPKVNQSTLNRINQIQAAQTKTGADKKAFGQERKKIFQNWEAELKGILTPEQYTTYLSKKEAQKKKMQENKASKKGGQPVEDTGDSDDIDE